MADLNPQLEEGDRVVLLYMDDHHSPVKAGTVGTVVSVERIPWGDLGYQYRMIWDNKSTLSLDPELDSWVFKKDWDEKREKAYIVGYLQSTVDFAIIRLNSLVKN